MNNVIFTLLCKYIYHPSLNAIKNLLVKHSRIPSHLLYNIIK
jgi:hypothetical protein